MVTWRKDGTGEPKARCFRCKSWRHPGPCREWKGAQDFVRIRDGIKTHPGGWVYLVLTFDPSKWDGEWWAYRGAIRCWDRLRKRMTREFGKVEYIQTWERHKSGWPHVNILVRNERLAELCEGDGWKAIRKTWLEPNAVACGFGMRTWLEPMKCQEGMAGYMAKLSRELVGADNKDQVPVNAPRHFRRLRASRGILPPVHKNSDMTGCLVKQPLSEVEHELLVRVGRKESAVPDGEGVRRVLQGDGQDGAELVRVGDAQPRRGGRHFPLSPRPGEGGDHLGEVEIHTRVYTLGRRVTPDSCFVFRNTS